MFKLKPLNGSPYMSENCWGEVLSKFEEILSSGRNVRYLEWGAGNSTISCIRSALRFKKNAEIVSVEDSSEFFSIFAASVIAELGNRNKNNPISATWLTRTPQDTPGSFLHPFRRRTRLESPSWAWKVITNNKHLTHVDGIIPNFSLRPLSLIKQILKLVTIHADFLLWSLRRRPALHMRPSHEGIQLEVSGNIEDNHKFLKDHIEIHQRGCLLLSCGNLSVQLWLLPCLSTVWKKGAIADGSYTQMPEYVETPLSGKFDLIFIDGRARVSCIRRVWHDHLLAPTGTLYVHDAFRPDMMSGFILYGRYYFVDGSNKTLSGEVRCKDLFGPPLTHKKVAGGIVMSTISNELFVHERCD